MGEAGVVDSEIVVKLIGKGSVLASDNIWRRQLPDAAPVMGRCRFEFDPTAREYDWLVVYDDLPVTRDGSGRKRTDTREPLACAPRNTLLVTVEPSSIKIYARRYTRQFGHVLSAQEPWALRHPGQILAQPALHWFYGMPHDDDPARYRRLDAMRAAPVSDKPRLISTVTSNKAMGHTLHKARFEFVQKLKAQLPELELFGRGVQPVDDKAEGLDDFRYHIAIENHLAEHHWTEKLADAFLGHTLPFYFGCPNAADYFPADSFIPIDIRDFDGALKTIRDAIASDQYQRRLPAIVEARRRVLEEYNLFAVLAREIEFRHDADSLAEPGAELLSRHAIRRSSPLAFADELFDRLRARLRRS